MRRKFSVRMNFRLALRPKGNDEILNFSQISKLDFLFLEIY